MGLTLGPLLLDAGIDPASALVIRHAYVEEPDGSVLQGLHANSTDAEIFEYTRIQSAEPRKFPVAPPPTWVVFIKEGGNQARLWGVLENRGEILNDGELRFFNLVESSLMTDLRRRLVIGWRSPRTWKMGGVAAAPYPVTGIADAEPLPFPGFDRLVLSHVELQAVMREHRYASWRTALSSVMGIYLITDTSDGRHYVGKADGLDNIQQRWSSYAANGHGGNVELKRLDAASFRFSLLRVFDPSTPSAEIELAENHFKLALDSRRFGLNRN